MSADPKIAELAPSAYELTSYDKEHAITYMRLLDADADKADWREIARIVLGLDAALEPEGARRTFESHLARAKWLASHGYRDLLRGGWPKE
ncbi:DNA -binding domain-containing protein [Bradyrhizobium sp. USDA 336]|uniref:DNA -binding domain-containing protein n=1 Tax=Bradyrhizobium sp. USDA 336 TaxID=3156311 RepID=UPI003836B561